MSAKDVIVLNSHGVGQYAYCDRMPRWGETLSVRKWHIAEDGGKGSNVTVALGRLGLNVAYVGKVGNDAWGDLGDRWMREAGADTTYLYRDPGVSTGTGLVLIAPDGRNSIIDGDSSGAALTIEEVDAAIDAMAGSKYFVTGFEIPEEVALAGARHACELGMKTVLNPSPLPEGGLSPIGYIDYLFVNEVESEHIAGVSANDPRELAAAVLRVTGAKNVVVTLGSEGSCALTEEGDFIEVDPVHVDNVANTAGAGDGFMAATVAGLVREKPLREAMEWASHYAALVVTIDGTIPAYRPLDEVEAFIERGCLVIG
ncbi:ribokinase [Olsenella uli]|uniref:ribokinase n=1 Tax=Olsenella uli TaxID=133926 RepID=UPI00241C976A|nr:ribokinase [Olsenella uli]